jgi:hypothetical protein
LVWRHTLSLDRKLILFFLARQFAVVFPGRNT